MRLIEIDLHGVSEHEIVYMYVQIECYRLDYTIINQKKKTV